MNCLMGSRARSFFGLPMILSRLSATESLEARICRSCKLTAPLPPTLVTLMKERNIVLFHQMTKSEDNKGCKFLNTFEFKYPQGCFLAEKLSKIAIGISDKEVDIKFLDKESAVFLEALKIPPKGSLGDLTGDYGRETINFLAMCVQKKILSEIGAIVDVGGRSLATVHLIRVFLKDSKMPALLMDINILTPFLSPPQNNISYAIGDAKCFFESEEYSDVMKEVKTDKPTLFLLSNFLSVLSPDYGWETLKSCWSRLRPEDVLIISNVVAKPLEKQNMIKFFENDGLVEYKSRIGNLSKTALAPDFSEFLEKNLKTKVIYQQPYEYAIETKRNVLGSVSGLHLLVVKKI